MRASKPHDQVFRNQTVGNTSMLAASAPRLTTVDADENIFRGRFGIFHEDVEVAVVVEHPGIQQLVLRLRAAAAPVALNQRRVGEGRLRVLVEVFHVGVRWRRIQIEGVLLDVLAMPSLVAG